MKANQPDPVKIGRFLDAVQKWADEQERKAKEMKEDAAVEGNPTDQPAGPVVPAAGGPRGAVFPGSLIV